VLAAIGCFVEDVKWIKIIDKSLISLLLVEDLGEHASMQKVLISFGEL
jgi:hypothetical protein